MELASILLNIGAEGVSIVPKYDVTPSEAHVLRTIHGADAVTEIDVTGEVARSSRAERERLLRLYGRTDENGNNRAPVVDQLFPGIAARMFETFEEAFDVEGDDAMFFKTEDTKIVQDPVERAERELAAEMAAEPTPKKPRAKKAKAEAEPEADTAAEESADSENLFE